MPVFTESYIQVPPDAGGRRIRTIQSVKAGFEVEEEVMQLQVNAPALLPIYAVCVLDQTPASNRHHLSIFNGSGSNKWLEILQLRANQAAIASSPIGPPLSFRIRRTTAAFTPGTALTPGKLDTSSPDLPAEIALQTGATPTVILTNVSVITITQPAEASYPDGVLQIERVTCQPLLLKEGEGITLQQYGTVGDTTSVRLHFSCLFRVRNKGS